MEGIFNKEEITVGISACLLGNKVRYDGSGKTSKFCTEHLGQYLNYQAFCPEVAIGLPVPRPSIRQIKRGDEIIVAQADGSGDVSEALKAYGQKVAAMTTHLSGYIFCAKSPSCGMERVKIYADNGNALPASGIGLFAEQLMQANPLLPCEENGRLNDVIIRENFVARIYAYRHWQALSASGLSKHKLMEFHSCYKYTVMSHSLVAYKQLGRLLANADLALEDMAQQYITGLMAALKLKATRKNHANTLSHIQGYFARDLNSRQRQALAENISAYRQGFLPLLSPLTLIKHYLAEFPQAYLAKQVYLNPHPLSLKLRYAL